VDDGQEIAGGLLETRCDRAEVLEVVEEGLNQISKPIELAVQSPSDFAAGMGTNDSTHVALLDSGDEAVGVVTGVPDQCGTPCVGQKFLRNGSLVLLSWG